jgi:hypothetical protein
MDSESKRMTVNLGPVTLTAVILLAGIAWLGMERSAQAKYKQPGCAKFAKQVKTAKSPAAKQRLKSCKANRRVYGMLKNKKLAGTRSDGITVEAIYCASGVVFLGGGVYTRKGWRVENARIKGKNLTAVVRAKVSGGTFVIGTARHGKQWKIGTEAFGKVRDLGKAELTDARAECSKA